MQFNLTDGPPSTWDRYAVDGNHDGHQNVYDPADAIPSAANYLHALIRAAGGDVRQAILGYNHSEVYVNDVLARAETYSKDNLGTITIAPASADGACTTGGIDVPVGPVNLQHASRLASPRAYRTLPGWAMAAGHPPEPIDARLYDDVIWILRRYHLRVSAARENGHHTHGDGTAVDLIPADGTTQAVWDGSRAGSPTTSAGRPPAHPPEAGLRATGTRDPVHRLRRLPRPRLTAYVPRRLPGPHPRLLGLTLLRHQPALSAVRVRHGVQRRDAAELSPGTTASRAATAGTPTRRSRGAAVV